LPPPKCSTLRENHNILDFPGSFQIRIDQHINTQGFSHEIYLPEVLRTSDTGDHIFGANRLGSYGRHDIRLIIRSNSDENIRFINTRFHLNIQKRTPADNTGDIYSHDQIPEPLLILIDGDYILLLTTEITAENLADLAQPTDYYLHLYPTQLVINCVF
jgi:hypothetical protein